MVGMMDFLASFRAAVADFPSNAEGAERQLAIVQREVQHLVEERRQRFRVAQSELGQAELMLTSLLTARLVALVQRPQAVQ